MRLNPVVLFTVSLVLLIHTPSLVLAKDSSPYVVVDTGQAECYGSGSKTLSCPESGEDYYGQDGQYQGPQPSYRDNSDGTVTDQLTGLMWQKMPTDRTLTWEDALRYGEDLELAGHSDWRLPSIKELYSIVDFTGSMRTKTPYIDTEYFGFKYPDSSMGVRDMDAQYWSSTKYVGTTMRNDQSAFGFNFADGRIKSYPVGKGRGGKVKKSYVRCVRGNSRYGENGFTANGDGTITDTATGLMWMEGDSGMAMKWPKALKYAEELEIAGYADWRLPNAKELQSIVDYTRAPDASSKGSRGAAINPLFKLQEEESWYWTSTTHGDNGYGIYIAFGQATAYDRRTGKFTVNAHGAGAQRSDPKSGEPSDWPEGHGPQADEIRVYNFVRCVRGN